MVHGPGAGTRYAAYARGLAVMIAAVLVLKLIGAALALAAITPRRLGLTAVGLWGAFGLLALYSVGSAFIAFRHSRRRPRTFRGVDGGRWCHATGLVGAPLLLAVILGLGPALLSRAHRGRRPRRSRVRRHRSTTSLH